MLCYDKKLFLILLYSIFKPLTRSPEKMYSPKSLLETSKILRRNYHTFYLRNKQTHLIKLREKRYLSWDITTAPSKQPLTACCGSSSNSVWVKHGLRTLRSCRFLRPSKILGVLKKKPQYLIIFIF